jgi:hypothetical protein
MAVCSDVLEWVVASMCCNCGACLVRNLQVSNGYHMQIGDDQINNCNRLDSALLASFCWETRNEVCSILPPLGVDNPGP